MSRTIDREDQVRRIRGVAARVPGADKGFHNLVQALIDEVRAGNVPDNAGSLLEAAASKCRLRAKDLKLHSTPQQSAKYEKRAFALGEIANLFITTQQKEAEVQK